MARPSNSNDTEISPSVPATALEMKAGSLSRPLPGDPARRRQLAGGLLAASVLVLTGVASVVRRSGIEAELRTSVLSAVSIDHPGLDVSVVGRDVTIRGVNLDGAAKKNIFAVAQRRRGVRTVTFAGTGTGSNAGSSASATPGATDTATGGTGGTGAIGAIGAIGTANGAGSAVSQPPANAVRPPQVTAVFDAASVTVSGQVPTAEAKDALLGRLKKLPDGVALRDAVKVSTAPAEVPDLPQYRRLGTFFETVARLPVRSAELNFDRTILTLKAEVADDARRQLLERESVVLVGGRADQVRAQIVLTMSTIAGETDPATASEGTGPTSSTVSGQATNAAGGLLTVPPLPATPAALAAQTAITTAIDGRTIGFEKSSAALSDSGRKVVADVVGALTSNAAKIEVGGHTDWKGSASGNQKLSQERAEAVRQALIDAGVAGSRVTARGYGEDIPIATNETDAGRSKNRRIEIRVIG